MNAKSADRKSDRSVGNFVRMLVIGAAGVVLAAGSVFLWNDGNTAADYGLFRGEPSAYRTIAGIIRSAWSLDARGLIQFGILVLIGIPVARVVASGVLFLLRRDWLYSVISMIVLAILLVSLFGWKGLPGQ